MSQLWKKKKKIWVSENWYESFSVCIYRLASYYFHLTLQIWQVWHCPRCPSTCLTDIYFDIVSTACHRFTAWPCGYPISNILIYLNTPLLHTATIVVSKADYVPYFNQAQQVQSSRFSARLCEHLWAHLLFWFPYVQQLKARSAERVVPITVMHGSNSSTNKETAFPGNHILKCAYLLSCIRTGSYPGSLQRETELFLDGFTEWVLESPLDWQASERNQEITAPAKILSYAKPQENYNYSQRHYRWHKWYQSCGSKHKKSIFRNVKPFI